MKKKQLVAGALLLVVFMAGTVFLRCTSDPYRLRAAPRREWKNHAIADITGRIDEPAWITKEIADLKNKSSKDPTDHGAWLSPHLILMKNGEWIAYASICSKQDSRIHDIFIGRGSDGKWYYSTFHFCRDMVVLIMQGADDGQPESLQKFAASYFLRQFDGRSDTCLQKTWPPKRT